MLKSLFDKRKQAREQPETGRSGSREYATRRPTLPFGWNRGIYHLDQWRVLRLIDSRDFILLGEQFEERLVVLQFA
jgi:hypothetical protein